MPGSFLPTVEKVGLMTQLTECVLRLAVQQAAAWHAQWFDLGIAVNVDAAALLDLPPPQPHARSLRSGEQPRAKVALYLERVSADVRRMNGDNALRTRLIGSIFVEQKLISNEQLERALEIQSTTGERLGEIIVEEFGVSRLALAGVLADQWAELNDRSDSNEGDDESNAHEGLDVEVSASGLRGPGVVQPSDEARPPRPIGEIFMDLGFINSEQLDAALEVQRDTGERLGEVLVAQGVLTRLELANALAEKWAELQIIRPPKSPLRLAPDVAAVPAVPSVPSAAGHAAVEALENRLQALEQATAETPSREALKAIEDDLREALNRQKTAPDGNASDGVDRLSERVDEAAALSARLTDRIDGISASLDKMASAFPAGAVENLTGRIESLEDERRAAEGIPSPSDALESRVEDLEGRIAALREAESADAARRDAEHESLASAVMARVDEAVGAVQHEDDIRLLQTRLDEAERHLDRDGVREGELAQLRGAVEELAARPEVAQAVWGRFAELEGRLARLGADEGELAQLRGAVEELAARPEVAQSVWGRFAELEGRLERLGADEGELAQLRGAVEELAARPEVAQAVWGRFAELEGRLERLGADEGELAQLRGAVEELAARPEVAQAVWDRFDGLESRLARLGVHEGEIAELRGSLAELSDVRAGDATAVGARLAALEAAVESLRGLELHPADDLTRRSDDLAQRIAAAEARLDAIAAFEVPVAATGAESGAGHPHDDDQAAAALRAELIERLDGAVDSIRAKIDDRAGWVETQVEVASMLGARVEELERSGSEHAAWVARVEGELEGRLERLGTDVAGELAATRNDAAEVAEALRGGMDSLAARLDDVAVLLQQAPPAGLGEELRHEIQNLSSRLDERDATELTAVELLRSQLEAVAASMDLRVQTIEERSDEARIRSAEKVGKKARKHKESGTRKKSKKSAEKRRKAEKKGKGSRK